MSITDLIYAALAGAGVGAISGLFGIGGGFLLVPVINIVLGVPMDVAVGSCVCQVLGPATTALLARDIKREHLRVPTVISGGLIVGVVVGAWTLEQAKSYGHFESSGRLTPIADIAVLGSYFVLLVGLAVFAFWEVARFRGQRPISRGWIFKIAIPPLVHVPEISDRPVSLPVLCWFGLVVGLTSGLLGISGGLLLLPGFVFLLGLSTQRAVISSMVIVFGVSMISTAVHAWLGHIDLMLVVSLLFGGAVGARMGSDFGTRLSGPQVRFAFGCLLTVAAVIITARFVWILR